MNEGNWQAVAEQWQDAGASWLQAFASQSAQPSEPAQRYWQSIGESWSKWAGEWQHRAAQGLGDPAATVADRRFDGPAWQTPYFALLRDQYLATCKYWQDAVEAADMPPRDKERLRFAVRQWLDAMAPTNFPATNPEAIKLALATEGESLRKGAENLAADFAKGRVSMTDESAFAVGRNLAVTPGAVVYRNDLIELIQYAPATAKVHQRPLLIVPPCINKYYILDLQPGNSLVRYAVGEGHTVFMISWRNIPPELGGLTWDDYLEQGVFAALAAVKAIAGAKSCNALGFCVGGTLLACALAILAARGDDSVASLTLLTTMLDYADPGQIGVYIDEMALAAREPALLAGERINGSELAGAFASLRANELVWTFVINNYLKGRTPPAFDLLYWNGDSANLPGPMYAWYLRNCYIGNLLREPGQLTLCGTPVDLGAVRLPAYVLATREDHIVPWRSAYRSVRLLGGDAEFVLGGSGHIAGVINPAAKNRREYWVDGLQGADADEWLASAEERKGSWWTHWQTWLKKHAGGRRAAPGAAGNREYPALDPAPGRYVLEAA
ncbi:MAG: class I poly(R)-hydroxyalkanoic acid synthase [Burkholderiales bacterium]|nr:class I poly(R)-hydroxyalkanoic acid synthase [Burkholderiales bacterium]